MLFSSARALFSSADILLSNDFSASLALWISLSSLDIRVSPDPEEVPIISFIFFILYTKLLSKSRQDANIQPSQNKNEDDDKFIFGMMMKTYEKKRQDDKRHPIRVPYALESWRMLSFIVSIRML